MMYGAHRQMPGNECSCGKKFKDWAEYAAHIKAVPKQASAQVGAWIDDRKKLAKQATDNLKQNVWDEDSSEHTFLTGENKTNPEFI
jgi:hypothetical protein